jgi:hypothetical protein
MLLWFQPACSCLGRRSGKKCSGSWEMRRPIHPFNSIQPRCLFSDLLPNRAGHDRRSKRASKARQGMVAFDGQKAVKRRSKTRQFLRRHAEADEMRIWTVSFFTKPRSSTPHDSLSIYYCTYRFHFYPQCSSFTPEISTDAVGSGNFVLWWKVAGRGQGIHAGWWLVWPPFGLGPKGGWSFGSVGALGPKWL